MTGRGMGGASKGASPSPGSRKHFNIKAILLSVRTPISKREKEREVFPRHFRILG